MESVTCWNMNRAANTELTSPGFDQWSASASPWDIDDVFFSLTFFLRVSPFHSETLGQSNGTGEGLPRSRVARWRHEGPALRLGRGHTHARTPRQCGQLLFLCVQEFINRYVKRASLTRREHSRKLRYLHWNRREWHTIGLLTSSTPGRCSTWYIYVNKKHHVQHGIDFDTGKKRP